MEGKTKYYLPCKDDDDKFTCFICQKEVKSFKELYEHMNDKDDHSDKDWYHILPLDDPMNANIIVCHKLLDVISMSSSNSDKSCSTSEGVVTTTSSPDTHELALNSSHDEVVDLTRLLPQWGVIGKACDVRGRAAGRREFLARETGTSRDLVVVATGSDNVVSDFNLNGNDDGDDDGDGRINLNLTLGL